MAGDQTSIDLLVKQVVDLIHPLPIILFGSTARGESTPESDVDLLLVMPDGTHRRHTAQKLYRDLRGMGIPFDLVVATQEDLERHKDNPGLIYRHALETGTDLYAV